MFRASHKRGWRGAIGLIAAYALVLQAFLAYSMVSQAAAQGDSPYSGSFFVLCTSQDDASAADHAGTPVKPVTHCPICTLSASAAATLPGAWLPIFLPGWQVVSAAQTPFVFIPYAPRPHSRGPPATV